MHTLVDIRLVWGEFWTQGGGREEEDESSERKYDSKIAGRWVTSEGSAI